MSTQEIRSFACDYDLENDSLFIYDARRKGNASVELDSVVLDFTSKGEISSLEILGATAFLKQFSEQLDRDALTSMTSCKVGLQSDSNYMWVTLLFALQHGRECKAVFAAPNISEGSPALAFT